MRPILIPNTFDLLRLETSDGKSMFSVDNMALYVVDDNPSVPTNNGLGVLADAISCRIKQRINGEYELVMTYPMSGALFDQIELRAVIVAQANHTGTNQPFRIYRITKPLNGVVTIYARHLAYDLAGIVVRPFTANNVNAALTGLANNAMTLCPFSFFSSSMSTEAVFTNAVPTPIWSLLGGAEGSLLDVYGGEYIFDGYTIRLEHQIGADNGVSVRYGVNLTDLEQDASCANCYTGVVAYWEEEGTVVYSPVISAGGQYGYVKIMAVDMSGDFENEPTVEQLTEAAAAYIEANDIGIPKVSWKINFVPLDMTEEYKDTAALERVNLGDTVTVRFEKLGVDASARVNEIEWNVLLDRYVSVSLGSVRSNIADTISNQSRELSDVPNRADVQTVAARVSSALTADILGANGGYVRLVDGNGDGVPDTLYIADNDDPVNAVKVWRFNSSGWAASSHGYTGPFWPIANLQGGLPAELAVRALDVGYVDSNGVYHSGEATINGETGTIVCKQLFVNGREITGAE